MPRRRIRRPHSHFYGGGQKQLLPPASNGNMTIPSYNYAQQSRASLSGSTSLSILRSKLLASLPSLAADPSANWLRNEEDLLEGLLQMHQEDAGITPNSFGCRRDTWGGSTVAKAANVTEIALRMAAEQEMRPKYLTNKGIRLCIPKEGLEESNDTTEEEDVPDECGICLEPLDTDCDESILSDGFDEPRASSVTFLDPCGHAFHALCIKQWLSEKRDCPFCRKFTILPEEYPELLRQEKKK